MADPIDELLREIAAKHGVLVGRNDPILMLHTINQRLLEDGVRAYGDLLSTHKEELEGLSMRWSGDAKDKAERVLNAAVAATKDIVAKVTEQCASEAAASVRKEVEAALNAARAEQQATRSSARAAITASALAIGASAVTLILSFVGR